MAVELSIMLAFVAGMFTVTTPCLLTILPVILAGSMGHKLRPMLIVLGQAISFTLMGGLFSAIGIFVGEFVLIMRSIFLFFIMGFGLVMISERINELYAIFSSRLANLFWALRKKLIPKACTEQEISKSHPLLGALILGLSFGIVWVPCIGPILGSILSYTSYEGNLLFGSAMLFIFSMGVGLPLLAIAYGGKYVSGRLDFVTRNYSAIEKISGLILIAVSVIILLQLDQYLISPLLPYFPDLESMFLK